MMTLYGAITTDLPVAISINVDCIHLQFRNENVNFKAEEWSSLRVHSHQLF